VEAAPHKTDQQRREQLERIREIISETELLRDKLPISQRTCQKLASQGIIPHIRLPAREEFSITGAASKEALSPPAGRRRNGCVEHAAIKESPESAARRRRKTVCPIGGGMALNHSSAPRVPIAQW